MEGRLLWEQENAGSSPVWSIMVHVATTRWPSKPAGPGRHRGGPPDCSRSVVDARQIADLEVAGSIPAGNAIS